MSETLPNRPRAGCWLLVMPLIAIPTVLMGYVVLVWFGYVGVPADGDRVTLDVRTCQAAEAVIQARIADMGLGDPVFSDTVDGFTALVTLPANDFAEDIPAALAKGGRFEVRSGGVVVVDNTQVASTTLRLDFTGEPSIAIQLDEDGTQRLLETMQAHPDDTVALFVDGEAMGERVNRPANAAGRITLPITGADRPSQVAKAAEFGLVMARPLPCDAVVAIVDTL